MFLAAGLLGGCDTFREGVSTVVDVFENPRPWPNERRMLNRDWIVRQVQRKEPETYCYRTLGRIECYHKPLPGADDRLVEDYTPEEKKKERAEAK
jgi:hypothetical protein